MKRVLSYLLMVFVVLSCDQDNNDPLNEISNNPDTGNSEFSQYFGNPINRTFLGTVIDQNHDPISDVTITIGEAMAQTDANGVFIISDASVYQRFGYIKAEKAGYISGSRSVVPSEGTNKVEIMLLQATTTATVNSGSIESVSLGNGASVELPGNYSNADGSSYTGAVDVVLHHLDPADEDMPLQMPGMLYAANSENQERLLQTYGMLAVELKGSSGESLNLTEGSTAQITVPLDASLQADAPATIPLWYFNEEFGYWVEEGEATLVGNAYVGTVTHFSFWNIDVPYELIKLCVNVSDEAGNALSNLTVTITSDPYGTRSGYTNENGQTCGLVPSNQTLELNVYNYDVCGNTSIFTTTIGPYSADDTVDITVPDNPDLIIETVTGVFNDCDDNPVTEGYVNVSYGTNVFSDYVTDGNFEINLVRCNYTNTFGLEAYDIVNLQATDSLTYTFTTPYTNLGILTACNSVDEFIYFVDNGTIIYHSEDINVIFNESDPIHTGLPSIYIDASSMEDYFFLFGVINSNIYLGSYDSLDWNMPGDTGFSVGGFTNQIPFPNNIVYNLNTLGEVGEYIDINFSGSYTDSQNVAHTINGVIHVIRDN